MTTLFRGRAYAEYRCFVLTDDYGYILTASEWAGDDTTAQGFQIARPNVVLHYIQNELWSVALVVHAADGPPADLLDAERVIHLPISLRHPLLLHGSTDWQKESFDLFNVGPGEYSIFSRGWNVGDYRPSEEECDLPDDEFVRLPHIEKYEWFICPMTLREPKVLFGPEII